MNSGEIYPIISVIMGAYQIEKLSTFDKAITSILSQTLTQLEFIICDDGSTDSTWDLLSQYARKDVRIRLLHNEQNQGLAFTLNRCIQASRGQYIARQDADDISTPDRLEKQLAFLRTHKTIQFVGCHVVLWDEHGQWGKRCFPELPTAKDFLFTMPFVHGALMFRKESLQKANGYRVAKETRRAEDYDLLMRMYALGMRGYNIQESLYEFCEDQAAQKRRKYCYRIDEAIVRWKGFSALHLLPYGIPYVIKPLLVGLLPKRVLRFLKRSRKF